MQKDDARKKEVKEEEAESGKSTTDNVTSATYNLVK
jgi:hypothetical protein